MWAVLLSWPLLLAAAPSAGLSAAPSVDPVAAPRAFHVAAGPLGGALSQLASEAGVLLVADARLTQGLSSRGFDGRATSREAFEILLAGSGLELVELADGMGYGLRARAGEAASAALGGRRQALMETVLPTVRARPPADEPSYREESTQAATHTRTPLRELPQSVSVVTRALIDDVAMQGLADAERFMPGVGTAQGEGNRDTPVFRGNVSTTDFLLDGLRDDIQYLRDLYDVAQVEALNGSNAMLLGANGAGGVINRVGKTPSGESSTGLRLQAGSWAQKRATLDWDHAGGDGRPDVRVNALVEDSGGYRDGFTLRRHGLHPVVAWHDAGTRVTLGAEYFHDARLADRGIPSYQGRPLATAPATFFGDPRESRSVATVRSLALRFEHDFGPGVSLVHQTRIADYEKFFQNAFAGGAATSIDGVLQVPLTAHNSLTRRRNLDSRTELSATLEGAAMRHEIVAGAEFGWRNGDYGRETGYFGATGTATTVNVPVDAGVWAGPMRFARTATDPDSASRATSLGLYLQDQLRLSPHWSVVAGLRHDILDVRMNDHRPVAPAAVLSSHDTPWSPRVGAVYAPLPALSLYASFGVGYVPRAGDQLAGLTPANAALSPERFSNREVGAKWAVTPRLDATAALYVLDRRNVAVASADPASADLSLADGQRSRGLELGLNGALSSRWRIASAYALQDSRLRSDLSTMAASGAAMPHVPRHSLSVWARADIDARWSAGAGATYRGAIFASTDNLVVLPGYVRFDAGLFLRATPATQLQLNVENLLDRRYAAFAQSDNNITPGSPRAWRLSWVLTL